MTLHICMGTHLNEADKKDECECLTNNFFQSTICFFPQSKIEERFQKNNFICVFLSKEPHIGKSSENLLLTTTLGTTEI